MPIKQAMLLGRFGDEVAKAPEAKETLGREETHYVVELFGVPARMARMGEDHIVEELRATTSLNRKGKRSISPENIEARQNGELLTLVFRFPRTDPITLADKQVEFVSSLGPLEFKRKFKVKAMVYSGQLAL